MTAGLPQDRPTELSGGEVDRAVVVPDGAAAAGLRIRSVLVAAAWAEHETAHAEYARIKKELLDRGLRNRRLWRTSRLRGAHTRLTRSWLSLHELGEVELTSRMRRERINVE